MTALLGFDAAVLALIIGGALLTAATRPDIDRPAPRRRRGHGHLPLRGDIWTIPPDHRAPAQPLTVPEAYRDRELHARCHASWCPRKAAAERALIAARKLPPRHRVTTR